MSLHADLLAASGVTFFSRGVVTDEVPVLLWATLNSLRKEGKEERRKEGRERREERKERGEIRRRTRGLAWKGTQRREGA